MSESVGPSALTPRKGRTLADTAASEVHRMILAGELPAGSPLRLNDLAAQLDMSPMPVRDAMRRLEALGLVEIIPHKGARVRELTEDDLRDTYEIRIELESLATARAALMITPDAVERAAASLAQHEDLLKAGDVDAARRAHTEFHFTIYRASGSLWLPRAIEPVWQNSERYRFATPDAERRRLSHLEHQAILDACAAHDGEAAAAALRAHLESTMHRILAAMSARG
ncbi:DNA-binding GntR family transcriptional regulator [Actinocorallia herbida]|uniref:DNA-binding GntR family transcriptional regulator n=1 Tax=Actinocorallia herbida TaxID=58109 RepID=A0A3N1CP50_9ACTN|nr:GntR family transcriptional regulator [Actinocorallia herbida]ROO83072.1 DNA-binding GntR family transcriptional regulator [Actinocorallia herbida]